MVGTKILNLVIILSITLDLVVAIGSDGFCLVEET